MEIEETLDGSWFSRLSKLVDKPESLFQKTSAHRVTWKPAAVDIIRTWLATCPNTEKLDPAISRVQDLSPAYRQLVDHIINVDDASATYGETGVLTAVEKIKRKTVALAKEDNIPAPKKKKGVSDLARLSLQGPSRPDRSVSFCSSPLPGLASPDEARIDSNVSPSSKASSAPGSRRSSAPLASHLNQQSSRVTGDSANVPVRVHNEVLPKISNPPSSYRRHDHALSVSADMVSTDATPLQLSSTESSLMDQRKVTSTRDAIDDDGIITRSGVDDGEMEWHLKGDPNNTFTLRFRRPLELDTLRLDSMMLGKSNSKRLDLVRSALCHHKAMWRSIEKLVQERLTSLKAERYESDLDHLCALESEFCGPEDRLKLHDLEPSIETVKTDDGSQGRRRGRDRSSQTTEVTMAAPSPSALEQRLVAKVKELEDKVILASDKAEQTSATDDVRVASQLTAAYQMLSAVLDDEA